MSVEFLNDLAEFLGERLVKDNQEPESEPSLQIDPSHVLLIKRVFRLFSQDGDVLDEAIEGGEFQFWREIFLLSVKYNRDLSQDALKLCYICYSLEVGNTMDDIDY
ncbi:hypothetical protein L0F63_002338 [Massospora cicadina]|nr:hypothetical protein L0F63_002338 [Massospora cicadina]